MADTLVTGGTGTLGRVLVERLQAAGRPTRVLSRRAGEGHVVGDLATGEGIDAAVRGCDVVVHCATGRKDGETSARLVEAALRNGAPHLVFISIVGIDRIPLGYYREKLAVERLLAGSSLPYTILRATQFHDLVAAMLGVLGRVPGVLPVPRGVAFQPVDVRDVADRLCVLAMGEPAGRVADLGGPEVRTFDDLARAWLDARGRRHRVVTVPVPGRLAAAVRTGANLVPEHADGRITFPQYLQGVGVAR
ncbi:NAD(P)H-binding protein [Pseudonocardia halophobica]|uniref:Nucleotide-diphosphate-sugar epimerase n=1 Tax=Pseudonocardia halophobica TaxID=29401 RepID=A0A9W6L0J3_9PSEU|nr:NAD(P)H-binding protein [Pseudonocardia halophobica]GLL09920.1 nucleotide-diphosphate-sugar epimerase [Pseudonocardia halophobica]